MELFERIVKLAELFENNSQTRLAKRLDVPQPTLNSYLNYDGQLKIKKTLLDKILMVYPQISRDWLYFGEGAMQDDAGVRVALPPLITAVPPLRAACAGGSSAQNGNIETLLEKLLAAQELNARLNDINARLTDEVLKLNEERRRLLDRMEWTGLDKTVPSPETVHCESPEKN